MSGEFKLLMLGAMYENGGNTTHRFLDGHPELYTYPFESQLGTFKGNDYMTSMWPQKYRWPVFDQEGDPYTDYKDIIDEECKVRSRTPHVSKFRHWTFDFSDDDRRERYVRYVERLGRSRRNSVEAFYRATFDAWKNYRRSGKEKIYVGYSPVMIIDAEKIMQDLPNSHVLHVVRNPWSAYADTKNRPVPQSLGRYLHGWCINQYFALMYRDMFPGHVHVIRLEDVLANPLKTLGALCEKIGISRSRTLGYTSWNGQKLGSLYPWGHVQRPNPKYNRAAAARLSSAELAEVTARAKPFLQALKYDTYLKSK